SWCPLEGAAAGLDERLDGGEHRARLRREVAAMLHASVCVVGDLAGREENGLRARDPDALAVARRIVHAGRAVRLDLRHARLLPPGDDKRYPYPDGRERTEVDPGGIRAARRGRH